jgi:hypothetical protein
MKAFSPPLWLHEEPELSDIFYKVVNEDKKLLASDEALITNQG